MAFLMVEETTSAVCFKIAIPTRIPFLSLPMTFEVLSQYKNNSFWHFLCFFGCVHLVCFFKANVRTFKQICIPDYLPSMQQVESKLKNQEEKHPIEKRHLTARQNRPVDLDGFWITFLLIQQQKISTFNCSLFVRPPFCLHEHSFPIILAVWMLLQKVLVFGGRKCM